MRITLTRGWILRSVCGPRWHTGHTDREPPRPDQVQKQHKPEPSSSPSWPARGHDPAGEGVGDDRHAEDHAGSRERGRLDKRPIGPPHLSSGS